MRVLPAADPGHLVVIAAPASQRRARIPPSLLIAVLVMGVTALIAQVVLVRELLSLFLGNELSIAFVLAIWLAAVAAGSAIGARLAPRVRSPESALGFSQLALTLILPAELLVARSARPPGMTLGEAWGPGAMLLVSFETLGLVCLLVGIQFVLAAAAASERRAGREIISPVAQVYALEAAGAALGGLAFHFWLSQHIVAFGSLGSIGLLNVISAALLLRPRLRGRGLAVAGLLLVFCGALAALVLRAPKADLASLSISPRWQGYRVLSHAPSKYGDLTSTVREGQLSLFQSGVLVFTSEDDYAAEVAAHLPLAFHAAPRTVLLIGSALGRGPAEILEHPITRLDWVELDPKLGQAMVDASRLAERFDHAYRPPSPIDDARAHPHFQDARLFVKRVRAHYDVIVVSVPDPTTASLNRFYTVEFFREARRALAPNGILAITLSGSPHHLSGAVLLSAAITDRALRRTFPNVLLVPGDTMFFLASEDPRALSAGADTLAQRLLDRKIETQFVNDAWLRDALLPFRAEMIRRQLSEVPHPPLNTDLGPVSYHYQTRIWIDRLSPKLAAPMRGLADVKVWWAGMPLVLAALLVALTRGRSLRLRPVAVLAAAAAVGGFGLIVEIVGLLVFQAALGYLYHAIGVLIAAFMAGLAAGAAVLSSRHLDRVTSARLLVAGLLTSVLLAALLPGLLRGLLPAPTLAGAATGLLFLLVGSLVGAMFPIAVALYRWAPTAAAGGGAIYAADLIGSAGAAVFAGGFAVPLLGVMGTAQFTALLLAAALVLALPLLREPA